MAVAGGSAWILQVSLTFGLAITALAYSIGHYSGGHINCAVTLGLVISGQCCLLQGLGNLVAQVLGSLAGAGILCVMFPAAADKTNALGSNAVQPGFGQGNAMVAEAVLTFVLVWVVLQTACTLSLKETEHRRVLPSASLCSWHIPCSFQLMAAPSTPLDLWDPLSLPKSATEMMSTLSR